MDVLQSKTKTVLVEDLVEFLNSTGACQEDLIGSLVNIAEKIIDHQSSNQMECTLLNVFMQINTVASQKEKEIASLLGGILDVLMYSQEMLRNLEGDDLCGNNTSYVRYVANDFLILGFGMEYIMEKRFGHLDEIYTQLASIQRQAQLKTYWAYRKLSKQRKSLSGNTDVPDRLTILTIQDYENICKIKCSGRFGQIARTAMTLSGMKKRDNLELFDKVELICDKIELCGLINEDLLEGFKDYPQGNETYTNIQINQNSFLLLVTRQHCRSESEWNEVKSRYWADNAESKQWIFKLMVELQIHTKTKDVLKNLQEEISQSIETQLGTNGNLKNMLNFLVNSMTNVCSWNKKNLFPRLQGTKVRVPVHYQHEELFLRYYPMFGAHMEINEEYNRSFKCVYKRAIRFLEMTCSGKFGFPGELHHPEKDFESCYQISTSFDSALVVPFLVDEEIDRITIHGLITAIKIHARPSGFWGYFDSIDENHTGMFPYDIDDTSIPMLALFVTGHKNKEECRENISKILACALKDSTGALGTWLPNLDNAPSGEPRKFLYTKPFSEIKMDVICLANFLSYSSIVEYDGNEKIQPSVTFVQKFIDELVENRGKSVVLKSMVYYPNRYPVYLFLSRLVYHSANAKKSFGVKLKFLIKHEILETEFVWEKGMNIACCILSALYLNLHEDDQNSEADNVADVLFKEKLHTLFSILLSLQLKDGSFDKALLFKMTHFGHYGGSKFVSTAFAVSALGRYHRQVVQRQPSTKPIY